MYNLGEQFKPNYSRARSDASTIIKGNKFRITIMTERLIRLEYNEEGNFLDKPTELIWFRDFERPKYGIRQDSTYLELTTKYFKLTYFKEKPFKGTRINQEANLKVELSNTDKIWYYNHPEARNFGSSGIFLSNKNGKSDLKKGLYSTDGFVSIDDSSSLILNEDGTASKRNDKSIDIYLFMYLKDFSSCLKDYFKLTGYPALIPRWALGNWWSRNVTYSDEDVERIIDEFNDKEIPLSVFLLSDAWHIKNYESYSDIKSNFTWNKELFKAPYELIDNIHKKNIKLGLNINPENFYPCEEYYDKAKAYLTPDKNGLLPFNVFDPKSVDVYLKIFIHPLENLGVDFFWLDNLNDKVDIKAKWLLNHYQSYDLERNNQKRPMILSYNSLVAAHRYPVLYSGKTIVSWDTLRLIPMHNSSASNIGISWWSHDIGGFHKGIEDNELYTRFVQLGTFSPILKFGSEAGKYYKREPWRWDVSTYEIAKDYLELRHKLIPYIYTEAYKYHKYGMPLIQPIYYKYPEMYDDPSYKNEYFFGTQFFVSPILTKKDSVMNRVIQKFYIPDGTWYDFVTGKKFPGGKSYISFFKDQDYPVFAKSGSIIPMGYNDDLNDTNPPKNMEIQIFPGISNNYKLYEDDGYSNNYKKGFYLITQIDYNYMPNNYTVILRPIEGKKGIVPETRNYKFRFRNTKEANDVVVYLGSEQIKSENYVDGPDFVVEVKGASTLSQLTINCKGKDIEIDAVRLINEDINLIIADLSIQTELKEKIDEIVFGELPIKKKRIAIRKLKSKGLEPKFITLFLKLLEYVEQV